VPDELISTHENTFCTVWKRNHKWVNWKVIRDGGKARRALA